MNREKLDRHMNLDKKNTFRLIVLFSKYGAENRGKVVLVNVNDLFLLLRDFFSLGQVV